MAEPSTIQGQHAHEEWNTHMQEEMERIRAERGAPASAAEREEDEKVLGFIEKCLRQMNVKMSKVRSGRL